MLLSYFENLCDSEYYLYLPAMWGGTVGLGVERATKNIRLKDNNIDVKSHYSWFYTSIYSVNNNISETMMNNCVITEDTDSRHHFSF